MLLDLPLFTLIHVLLSLFGILAGLVMVGGIVWGNHLARWTSLFLAATILTNITGFFFPFTTILPSHIVGVLSLFALMVALIALYAKRLAGPWRRIFVLTSILSLYLNVFVLVAQLLARIPVLAAIAPNPGAPAFAIAQRVVLVFFAGIGWSAMKRFQHA